jgi:hypothetical protein
MNKGAKGCGKIPNRYWIAYVDDLDVRKQPRSREKKGDSSEGTEGV